MSFKPSQSPIFPIDFDGPPYWSFDESETGESTKCPWVGVVEEGTSGEKK